MNRSNFIMSEKGINCLLHDLKISLIEEGASFVTLFVVRCVSNFLCFNIHFSLVSKNFHISYTPTPTRTRKQFLFLSPPPEKNFI